MDEPRDESKDTETHTYHRISRTEGEFLGRKCFYETGYYWPKNEKRLIRVFAADEKSNQA